jgi:hypothetical protein
MPHLEGRSEVEIQKLSMDRICDPLATVSGIHAPEAGGAVKDLAAVAVLKKMPFAEASIRGAALI